MMRAVPGRWLPLLVVGCLLGAGPLRAADADQAAVAAKALAVLNANCHRCHGQDGSAEGGMNFILDPAKLVARKKIVPGQPDQSLLFKRLSTGKMPPAGETPRPAEADIAVDSVDGPPELTLERVTTALGHYLSDAPGQAAP